MHGGTIVVSLEMAGRVPDGAKLVVMHPLQAGVMTVMLVESTARPQIGRQPGRRS